MGIVGRRVPQWPVWVIGGFFVIFLACRDFLLSNHGLIAGQVFWGRDYINLWTGGHLVREGRLNVLYDLQAYRAYQRTLFGPLGWHNYSYPPVSYPLAAAFALLPYGVSLAAWFASTGTLFVLAARKWWPERAGSSWLAVLTPAAIVNIWAGHYGFLVGALFLFGWTSLDEHPRRAGVFFGLLLIKPHLAVLVPVVLLLRREWNALATAAATVVLLVASTTIWFGWQPWSEFLFHTSGVQAALIDARQSFFRCMSTSTVTALMQHGLGWGVAVAAQALVAIAAVAMIARAVWCRIPTRQLAFLTATCTFLVLPYAFNYDLTVVCIGALALMNSPGVGEDEHRLGFYGFIAPQLGMVTGEFGLFLMPAMLIALAGAQFRCWVLRRTPEPDPAACVPIADLWPEQAELTVSGFK